MNLIQLLQELSIKGWQLWTQGEKLRYRAPNDESTDSVLAQLKEHKIEILKLLSDNPDILNVYPLSYGQRALWFLWQLVPESVAYNIAFTCRICSELNVTTLEKTLQILIDRHPLLRTTFPKHGKEPIQQVHQSNSIEIQQIDTSGLSEEELHQRVYQDSKQPFDLEKEPLMRVSLFNCSEDQHILLLTIHHTVADAWSVLVLVEELGMVYQALDSGIKPSLEPLKHSYVDYVRWQKDMLNSPQGEKLWNYWQKQLGGELPVLNLPTDRPRPSIQTYNGASYHFQLSQKLSAQLKELAQREERSLYMVLIAAFQVLLYRYTGQEDILLGSPTSGRTKQEFTPIFGYFVSPVVIRVNLSGNPSFLEFLSQVSRTVLEALAHQDFPFPLLIERLQLEREPSRPPIFQALFALQNFRQLQNMQKIFGDEVVDQKGLKLQPFEIPQQEGQFDLDLEMKEGISSLVGTFKYNTDLFNHQTIVRMADHFKTLLEEIVVNPQQKIGVLPLLTETQRHQLLVEWNDTDSEYPQYKCIHQLFEEQVEKNPDAIAVVFEQEQLTYAQLNQKANQLAHYLQSLGVKPEMFVGICVERSLEMVVGVLGIIKAGGAYVPLEPNYPLERLAYILEDADAGVLVTTKSLLKSLPKNQIQLVCLDNDWETIASHSHQNPVSNVDSSNLAYAIYTSGSTGKPKGVLVRHKPVINVIDWVNKTFDIGDNDRLLFITPLTFDLSVYDIFGLLAAGGSIYIVSELKRKEPEELINLLSHYQITFWDSAPAALEQLVPLLQSKNYTCNYLKLVLLSGDWIPLGLPNIIKESFPNVEIVSLGGATEATVWSNYYLIKEVCPEWVSIPYGKPIQNAQYYILNEYFNPCPVGVTGDLYIGGECLSSGYINNPDKNLSSFIPNPFTYSQLKVKSPKLYKTGDLARYLPDGNIQFMGRVDNQVKIRGFRIELGEIESVLLAHSQIQQTLVLARADNIGHKRLVAYVVTKDQSLNSEDLQIYLQQKLPNYMIPSAFVFLEALPLTSNGKIDRKALPTAESYLAMEGKFVPPRDNIEIELAQIWSRIFNITPMGVTNDFFDIGGHSLIAVRLMAEIEQKFHQYLSLATLFQNPTIEKLANLLRSSRKDISWSPLVSIKATGSKPPFFCVPGAGGNLIYFYDLARHLDQEQPFYGLQAQGLNDGFDPLTNIQDIASQYIQFIQTIQPQGPYFLGGHSFGGKVAFEMAQQLIKANYEVGLVAIFDTSAPIPEYQNFYFRVLDDTDWIVLLISQVQELSGREINIPREYIESLSLDEQFEYLKEKLIQLDMMPTQANINQVRAFMKVFQTNLTAIDDYLPENVSPTEIILFRTDEFNNTQAEYGYINQVPALWEAYKANLENLKEPTLGWHNFLKQPVEVYNIPGNHLTMMTQPHVQVLAQKLQKCLDKK